MEETSHVQSIIACPSCNGKLGLSNQHVGQPVKCPRCGAVFKPIRPPVPNTEARPEPEPEEKVASSPAPVAPRKAALRKTSPSRRPATGEDATPPPVPAGLKRLAM